ncbi:MAG: DNA topology modulation protein FlaR [Candidatus Ochrobactrum gambitense]|nr:MAG: DNA topology modulation protein FlaR [Candidatus Ochrobactrum gambitense]WEK17053.1 MAG: DNA topology modulation protein FlaR [Candidatus Ochrobactrum gambitense]
MIFGGAGSGKSMLARELGHLLNLPVIHIDTIYWQPGWVMRPLDEIARLTNDAADGDHWVFEGNHSHTMPHRASRADMLIFLDISTGRRLVRVVRRILKYHGRTRPDMGDGCPERFDWNFIKWVVSYRKNGRIRALKFMKQAPNHLIKRHLRSPRDVDAFLDGIRRETKQKQIDPKM